MALEKELRDVADEIARIKFGAWKYYAVVFGTAFCIGFTIGLFF